MLIDKEFTAFAAVMAMQSLLQTNPYPVPAQIAEQSLEFAKALAEALNAQE